MHMRTFFIKFWFDPLFPYVSNREAIQFAQFWSTFSQILNEVVSQELKHQVWGHDFNISALRCQLTSGFF